MRPTVLRTLAAAALGIAGLAPPCQALPSLTLDLVASVSNPLYVTHAGDDRLFIVERGGRVLIYTEAGGLDPTPFLDLTALVDDSLDGGLYTIAFHPNYASNGFFFVTYTATSAPLRSVVARYTVSATDPDVANPASATVLLTLEQPNGSHNNGQIAFGPHDGYLYIGFGDGGGGGGPGCRAQHDTLRFGKILRIDVNQKVYTPPFYGVPPQNPFADPGDGVLDEIWASGFRNPWRFSFDRLAGDLFISDVGQAMREEIDMQPAASGGGENYGWKVMEGTACFDPDPLDPSCPAGTASCFDPSYTPPIFEYATGSDCSVIGGYRYRGSRAAARGLYIHGDFCSGRIWALEESGPGSWTRTELLDAASWLTSFGEDRRGELYVTLGNGVHRLEFDGPTVPEVCGDGVVLLGVEACDDGNTDPGDGCGPGCTVEPCFACIGEPSACSCDTGRVCGALCGALLRCGDASGTCKCG
jgi:cysteine-rich repeat protein